MDIDALVDELLKGHWPENILNQDGLVQDLTKRLVERGLEGEMTDHLGYETHAREDRNGGKSRNGKSRKRIKTGESDGAKFWLSVLTKLRNRGVQDILIAAVDGLKGFPEAMESVYPKDPDSVVHCVQGVQLAALRLVEGAQGGDPRPADHLRGGDAGAGR